MAGQHGAKAADQEIAVAAPAKVNLYLHLTGRRANGYHLLDSLIVFAEAGDVIRARRTPGEALRLRVCGPFAQALRDDDNMALRAAGLLAEAAGRRADVALELEKNLPVAAGLGGGSADAAATLRALNRLWALDWPQARLAELGLALGADVPACLAGRPVFVGGIGELVCEAAALPPLWAVLVNPGRPLATPAVFAALNGTFSGDACWGWDVDNAGELCRLLAARRNDLQPAAIRLEPSVLEVLEALEALPGALLARMSGSGATCFALFESATASQAAASALSEARPGWWVVSTRLMTDPR